MEMIRKHNELSQQSFDLVEVTDEVEKALIESWHDDEYSHLQTFQYEGPRISKRKRVYDNSAKTTTHVDSDIQFRLKNSVTHISKRTLHDPNDHIRMRFSSPSIDKEKGNMNIVIKLADFIKGTGGLYETIEEGDYVSMMFKINDFDFAKQNDMNIHQAKLRECDVKHKNVGKSFNNPYHPGNAPVYTNPNELSFSEKCTSNSNRTYHVQTSNGDSKPIRCGVVQWNQDVQFNNYAVFAQQQEWRDNVNLKTRCRSDALKISNRM